MVYLKITVFIAFCWSFFKKFCKLLWSRFSYCIYCFTILIILVFGSVDTLFCYLISCTFRGMREFMFSFEKKAWITPVLFTFYGYSTNLNILVWLFLPTHIYKGVLTFEAKLGLLKKYWIKKFLRGHWFCVKTYILNWYIFQFTCLMAPYTYMQ